MEDVIADVTVDNDIPGSQQWANRGHDQIGLCRDESEHMDRAEILSRV